MNTTLSATEITALKTMVGTLLAASDDFSTDNCVTILEEAADLYHNDGESFLSDLEYDTLERRLKDEDPSNTFFFGVGSNVRGGKIPLPFPMGSLDQVYTNEAEKWIGDHNLSKDTIVVSDKLDGVSVMIVYGNKGNLQIAYSRGDGTHGADVSRHISKILSVPKTVNVQGGFVVRAECIISNINFDALKKIGVKTRAGVSYKNARNMIAGLMNAENNPAVVYKYISVVAYEVINSDLGKEGQLKMLDLNDFLTVNRTHLVGREINDHSLTGILDTSRKNSKFAIDGLVLDVNDLKKRQALNPTRDTLNPAYSKKFKVADDTNIAVATVTGITFNVSKHGYLKPTIHVEPVELVGVTVQNCTGFNAKYICDNEIQPGCKIKITRSGDVIPYCLGITEPGPVDKFNDWFQLTIKSFGSYHWTHTGVDLVIHNIEGNVTVQINRIVDFFASIDAPLLKEGNIVKLFNAGRDSIAKVITTDESVMKHILGANGVKAYEALAQVLHGPIPEYVLAGSTHYFGRGVGVRKTKKLYDELGSIQNVTYDQILGVDGFEEKTAKRIIDGLPAYLDFLTAIGGYYTFKVQTKASNALAGKVFVFTGWRDKSLESVIEQNGGKYGSGVSGKTTHVVAKNPNENSTKLNKARQLGINVISIGDLKKILATV